VPCHATAGFKFKFNSPNIPAIVPYFHQPVLPDARLGTQTNSLWI
jgi:hypothetical protein